MTLQSFLWELVTELVAVFVLVGVGYLFKEKIGRWVSRLREREHSRMLGVIDLTQTLIEGDILKVRTGQATTLGQFTLGDEELTEILHVAVQESYSETRPYVVIPQTEDNAFGKLKTLAYSWANTAFNEAAARERLKPVESRRKLTSVEGQLVLYAERDAEVSKVHLEMVPNTLWARLDAGTDGIEPERGSKSLLLRLDTLKAIRREDLARKANPKDYTDHLMVFRFVAEMIDERATVEAIVAEALERRGTSADG